MEPARVPAESTRRLTASCTKRWRLTVEPLSVGKIRSHRFLQLRPDVPDTPSARGLGPASAIFAGQVNGHSKIVAEKPTGSHDPSSPLGKPGSLGALPILAPGEHQTVTLATLIENFWCPSLLLRGVPCVFVP